MPSLDTVQFVGFDLETTGLKADQHEIIEIGAVRFSLKWGITGTFQQLIKPSGRINQEIERTTGINNDMVANAPPIEEVMPAFFQFIGSDPLLAYNAQFDTGFIGYHAGAFYETLPKNPIYDELQWLRSLPKERFPELTRFKLEIIVDRWKIPVDVSHRALSDSIAMMYVLNMCWDSYWKQERLSLEAIQTQHPPIHFHDFDIAFYRRIEEFSKMAEQAVMQKAWLKIVYTNKDGNSIETIINPEKIVETRGPKVIIAEDIRKKESYKYRIDRINACAIVAAEKQTDLFG